MASSEIMFSLGLETNDNDNLEVYQQVCINKARVGVYYNNKNILAWKIYPSRIYLNE